MISYLNSMLKSSPKKKLLVSFVMVIREYLPLLYTLSIMESRNIKIITQKTFAIANLCIKYKVL